MFNAGLKAPQKRVKTNFNVSVSDMAALLGPDALGFYFHSAATRPEMLDNQITISTNMTCLESVFLLSNIWFDVLNKV